MELALIARHDIFSTTDARGAGLDRHALARLVRDGACTRLTRGWYAVTSGPLDPERRHRLTARALAHEYRATAGLSHHSCLVSAGVATYAVDLGTVHLTRAADGEDGPVPRGGVSARRPGLAIHRPVPGFRVPERPSGPGEWDRPWRVPIACAVVQTGMVSGAVSALVSADDALHRGLVSPQQLADWLEVFRRQAGIAAVRVALVNTDGRHESPGETRLAHAARLLGFDLEPQFEVVAEGRRYRVDFRIKGTRVLVEFDGAVKYQSGGSVLFQEKQREDALRREGWVVVRVVWADLDKPARLRTRLLDAIATDAARR
jgi:very-short-patch-repair endonuclease